MGIPQNFCGAASASLGAAPSFVGAGAVGSSMFGASSDPPPRSRTESGLGSAPPLGMAMAGRPSQVAGSAARAAAAAAGPRRRPAASRSASGATSDAAYVASAAAARATRFASSVPRRKSASAMAIKPSPTRPRPSPIRSTAACGGTASSCEGPAATTAAVDATDPPRGVRSATVMARRRRTAGLTAGVASLRKSHARRTTTRIVRGHGAGTGAGTAGCRRHPRLNLRGQ
mmetsp:Transcript_26605/g.106576  ORF Transcript_26605/g.106576 Transcript_26605/m.106576 type:complete len:230 (+) Transcript_26605:358-1047(+)